MQIQQQAVHQDLDTENYSKNLWNNVVVKLINRIVPDGKEYPTWRKDNNEYDGDGPDYANETNQQKFDNPPNDKYQYLGLDDRTDWDMNVALMTWGSMYGLAIIVALVLLATLRILRAAYLIACLIAFLPDTYMIFCEVFDIADEPYGSPSYDEK
jgi:hypothetical protein